MGRIEKGFQAAVGGFAMEAVITPLRGQSPGLGWPPAVNEGPWRVTSVSLLLQLAHLKVGERRAPEQEERGHLPSCPLSAPLPHLWSDCFPD